MKKITDEERLDFYHGVILRFDEKADSLYRSRLAYYSRSHRTPTLFRKAIDAAIIAESKRKK